MTQATLNRTGHSTGLLRLADRDLRCVFGEAGVSAVKQEGDGATPCGVLKLKRVFYRADRMTPPACGTLPREPIAPEDGWCDEPTHAHYNQFVRLPHDARHERLWREDGLYDLLAVLGYNDDPVRRHRGSAIFLHVASRDEKPTKGCVALSRDDLIWALGAGLAALDIPCE